MKLSSTSNILASVTPHHFSKFFFDGFVELQGHSVVFKKRWGVEDQKVVGSTTT